MLNTNVKASTLLILLALIWMPETRVMLSLLLGNEANHTSVMKPLVACFELVFIAAVLLERKPLAVPQQIATLRIPALLWVLWMLLAALFSEHTSIALLRTSEWVTHGLFSITLIAYLYRESSKLKEVSDALLIGFLIYTMLYSLFVAVYDSAALGFDHIRHYGHYVVISLIMSLSINKRELLCYSSLFKISVLVIAWAALFWTGGRGPLLALFAVTAVLVFNKYFSERHYLLKLFVISSVVGFLISIPISEPGQGIQRVLSTISDSQGIESFSSKRVSLWLSTLPDIYFNPLFGLGPEGFIFGTGELVHPILHPHNSIIQFLVEWGVPGAIFFLWLLYQVFVPAFRKQKPGNENLYLFTALWAGSVTLFYSLLTGNLYIPFSLFLFVVIVSMIITGVSSDNERIVINKRWVLPVFILVTSATLFQGVVMARFVASNSQTSAQFRETLLKNAPAFVTHPYAQAKVIESARQHYREGKTDKALQWLQWGRERLPGKWKFDYAEAELLVELGRYQQAKKRLPNTGNIPIKYQDQVECLKQRIYNRTDKQE
jgi:O-antigen ligase